jgi:hypothetical protein
MEGQWSLILDGPKQLMSRIFLFFRSTYILLLGCFARAELAGGSMRFGKKPLRTSLEKRFFSALLFPQTNSSIRILQRMSRERFLTEWIGYSSLQSSIRLISIEH